MAFIFLLFLFSDLIKAETIDSNSYSEINKSEESSTKDISKGYFLMDIPRTKVSSSEKDSLSKRNPFLPFGQNMNGKSAFKFSEINLTGIVNMNGNNVAFIKTLEGTSPYEEGEIIGSGFKLLNIDEKNLIIEISDDSNIHIIKLEEDEN